MDDTQFVNTIVTGFFVDHHGVNTFPAVESEVMSEAKIYEVGLDIEPAEVERGAVGR